MAWSNSFAEWQDCDTAYLSVAFTWDLQAACSRAVRLRQMGYHVRAGGPAVVLMPHILKGVAELGGEVDALPHHNPQATFTSRGCPRRCAFCAVPKIEGELRELAEWEPRPIVCDNNLMACSRRHFDRVIDRLRPLTGIDFIQGMDAGLLTKYHAERLTSLDCIVRLAWDNINTGNAFMAAYEKLRKAGLPKHRIQVCVLIGYQDTPGDAWFRLRTVHNLGVLPNPMRYNPLDTLVRDVYVNTDAGWTDRLLTQTMRYWTNLSHTAGVPFDEWLARAVEAGRVNEWQTP